MKDEKKTKKQLIEELVLLRREISKLKTSKAGGPLSIIRDISDRKRKKKEFEPFRARQNLGHRQSSKMSRIKNRRRKR